MCEHLLSNHLINLLLFRDTTKKAAVSCADKLQSKIRKRSSENILYLYLLQSHWYYFTDFVFNILSKYL